MPTGITSSGITDQRNSILRELDQRMGGQGPGGGGQVPVPGASASSSVGTGSLYPTPNWGAQHDILSGFNDWSKQQAAPLQGWGQYTSTQAPTAQSANAPGQYHGNVNNGGQQQPFWWNEQQHAGYVPQYIGKRESQQGNLSSPQQDAWGYSLVPGAGYDPFQQYLQANGLTDEWQRLQGGPMNNAVAQQLAQAYKVQ